MGIDNRDFNWCTVRWVSVVVLIICSIASWVILNHVTPLETNQNGTSAMSFLAAVLAMLAGGCIAGFFSFEYEKTENGHDKNKNSEVGCILLSAYLLIGGIFVFTFLSIYCLQKADVLSLLDCWAKCMLFIGIYAVLDAIVLLERWDATTLP